MPAASGKVVVSYGYANQEARALVMSEAFFDELFANASQCGAKDQLAASAPSELADEALAEWLKFFARGV